MYEDAIAFDSYRKTLEKDYLRCGDMQRLIYLFSFVLLATGNIELPHEAADPGQVFGKVMMKVGMRLQEIEEKRPHRLKGMNDSLASMAEAMRLMTTRQDPEAILHLLEQSQASYPNNSFSYLLKAVVKSSQADSLGANKSFEQFLLRSQIYSDFEKSFIHWHEFHKLRRIVHQLLLSRGVNFEGREKKIQVRIPFESLMEYVRNPKKEDEILNLSFILVFVVGIFFMVWSAVVGADFSSYWMRTFVSLYSSCWIAYAVWIIDLAFGLPFNWSRFFLIPVILGGAVLLRFIAAVSLIWSSKAGPIAEGYFRCPGCGEIIQKILTECSKCRRKF